MTNEQLLRHVADVLRAVSDGNYPEDWNHHVGLCANLDGVLAATRKSIASFCSGSGGENAALLEYLRLSHDAHPVVGGA